MMTTRPLAVFALLATTVLGSTITAKAAMPFPTILRRQDSGCAGFASVESSCALATNDFTALQFSDQASCLCYTSSTYAPNVFDAYWTSCLSYYKTQSPSFYSSLGGSALPTAPCIGAGTPASTTAISSAISSLSSAISSFSSASISSASASFALSSSVTSFIASGNVSATSDPNKMACSSWNKIETSCEAATSNFDNMPFSQEASCLCYTSRTVYAPLVYDGYWHSCLRYVQTANSTLYSELADQGLTNPTPCQELGNILASTTSSSHTSSSSSTSSSMSTPRSTSATTSASASASATASRSDATAYECAKLVWLMSIAGAVTLLFTL